MERHLPNRLRHRYALPITPILALSFGLVLGTYAEASWRRHTIDLKTRGADGVRLADVNGDGWLDAVTPWEEGGLIRVCLHPGPRRCKSPWPAVTVGHVRSPEDAVFLDIDGDDAHDVVSCCEGSTRTVYVHWAPTDPKQYMEERAWTTAAVPVTRGRQQWMFALPMDVDARYGQDLIVGSKGVNGSISWLELPENARDLDGWKLHSLRPAGWIMSLVAHDMDEDGDPDIVASDRKGLRRGVLWLENPGPISTRHGGRWREHTIGGKDHEVMFLDLCDLDKNGRIDLLVATRKGQLLLFRRSRHDIDQWNTLTIANPYTISHGKAVRVGDIDLDGRPDIAHSANTYGNRLKPGVAWLRPNADQVSAEWTANDVSRDEGVKFDLIQLYDVDHDGDLDILTTEEHDNLGVIWYENPTRNGKQRVRKKNRKRLAGSRRIDN